MAVADFGGAGSGNSGRGSLRGRRDPAASVCKSLKPFTSCMASSRLGPLLHRCALPWAADSPALPTAAFSVCPLEASVPVPTLCPHPGKQPLGAEGTLGEP